MNALNFRFVLFEAKQVTTLDPPVFVCDSTVTAYNAVSSAIPCNYTTDGGMQL